jgi:glycosyltransferase involved in cell wall biosynthesis
MNTPTLTVIIATKNEAHNIEECIASVKFADTILVLDSASTDSTATIARNLGATVHITDWPGYGAQQLRGIRMAQTDWVLSLDADERISEALQKEILGVISIASTRGTSGYRLPRRSSFCGQFMKAGGWTPDYTLRLAKTDKAGFTDHFLHAHMTVDGAREDLKHPIAHYSYRNLDDVLEKLNRYSRGAAIDAMERGATSGLTKALLKGFWAFLRTYIFKAGFVDGRMGLVLALFNGQTTYYKYLRIFMNQRSAAVQPNN